MHLVDEGVDLQTEQCLFKYKSVNFNMFYGYMKRRMKQSAWGKKQTMLLMFDVFNWSFVLGSEDSFANAMFFFFASLQLHWVFLLQVLK